ncbi:hypothetical protein CYY_001567 [Polysphondylium violaceum]|uniref:Carbohydrate binding domain-containing protein n=1 Tax=Polysphondylium violaceum TaxID=133409 RepID=A0A8J4Q0V2_9MYCE|nr:hypothetical protein CYY_001567 [Polysphondylium violaceum]
MKNFIFNILVLYLAIGFNLCNSDSIELARYGDGGYVSLAESKQAFTTSCTYKDKLGNHQTNRYMIRLDEATQNHYLNISFTSDDLPENVVFHFDDFNQHESYTPISYSLCKGGTNQIYFNLALNNFLNGGDVIISIISDVSKMCGPEIKKPDYTPPETPETPEIPTIPEIPNIPEITETPEIPEFSYQITPEKYNRTSYSSGTTVSFNSLLIFSIFIIFLFI